jgi:hypothetical protein
LSCLIRLTGCRRDLGLSITLTVASTRFMLRFAQPIDRPAANRPSTKRERRRRILAARHTAPAEGVPSLASAPLVNARINYDNNGTFFENRRGCNTEGERHKKARPVAAMHYRKRSDSFQSRREAGAGNRRVAMASSRSKVRVAVRALVKRRERTRRRIRRRTLSASIVRA